MASCASTAATTASVARGNTAKNESPSPRSLSTMPALASMAAVSSWSCRRMAWYIEARLCSHIGVDSATSVIRKVTMPSGSVDESSTLNPVPGEVVVVPSAAARGKSDTWTIKKSSIARTRRKKCTLYEARKLHSE